MLLAVCTTQVKKRFKKKNEKKKKGNEKYASKGFKPRHSESVITRS